VWIIIIYSRALGGDDNNNNNTYAPCCDPFRLPISCICPCCLCVTVVLEAAVELIKAPLHVITWFTSKIPC
jgi:hypothetical protein